MILTIRQVSPGDMANMLDFGSSEEGHYRSALAALADGVDAPLISLVAVDERNQPRGCVIGWVTDDITYIAIVSVERYRHSKEVAMALVDAVREFSVGITKSVTTYALADDSFYIGVLEECGFHEIHRFDTSDVDPTSEGRELLIMESPVDYGGIVLDEILHGNCKTIPFSRN